MSAGVCNAEAAGPVPPPAEPPPDGAGDEEGGGVAGETAGSPSPGGSGVLGAVAGGKLPYTGLPLWAIALAGALAAVVGVFLRRERPALGAGP